MVTDFQEHPTFSRNTKKFFKKYYEAGRAFRHLKKLLDIHFAPNASNPMLSPKVLKRINKIGPNIEAFKVIMNVKGIKQGSCPRVCFWKTGNLIIFLCFGSHINNYKDSQLKNEVKQRIKEINPNIEFQ